MNRRQKIIVSVTGIFLVLLLLVGLTYAYFLTKITGNTNDKSISVSTADLKVEYLDGNSEFTTSSMDEVIMPGFIYAKQFTVENKGNATTEYSIKLDNITNEFIRSDWKFTLYSGTFTLAEYKTGIDTSNVLKSGILPFAKSTYLENSVSIEVGASNIDNYTLVLEYLNLDEDQSIDMDKNLTLRVNIDNEVGKIFKTAEEGTLLKAIGNDNLISEILTAPGTSIRGTYASKGHEQWLRSNQSSESPLNTYILYGTDYEVSEDGIFKLLNVKTGKYSEIYSQLEGAYFLSLGNSISFSSTEEELANLPTSLDIDNIMKVTSPTATSYVLKKVNRILKTGEAILSYAEDDYSTSYFYRGLVENNYVNYLGMCWRIVRTEGNGNVKLTLADKNNFCNDSSYTKNNADAVLDNKATYGLVDGMNVLYENSNVHNVINSWMVDVTKTLTPTHFATEHVWCNDINGESSISNPSFKCTSTEMKFDFTFGSLTMDELVYSGYTNLNSSYSYLLDNAYFNTAEDAYWTMTAANPEAMYAPRTFYMSNYTMSNGSHYVRPAVLLSGNAPVTTNNDTATYGEPGTINNPYVIN